MRFLILTTASLILWTTCAFAITGREVMEERDRRHNRNFEESWVVMNLYDKRGKAKAPRLMITYSRKESELDQRLVKFAEPADIRSVGLLTWEQPGDKEDDQWLYLPAAKKVKRIAGSGKKNQFMGTDLAFEDLRPENLAAHEYTISGEKEIQGAQCWEITATPSTSKEKKGSGYSKRVIYIRQDNYFPVRTEYYNTRGKPSKTATSDKLIKVAGQAWRSDLATIERLREG
ncbi:MAG: outer membrane lipoprotein-sorting protein, partial [Verrucomicrobiales bacterium]